MFLFSRLFYLLSLHNNFYQLAGSKSYNIGHDMWNVNEVKESIRSTGKKSRTICNSIR